MGRAGTKFFMHKGETNVKIVTCTPCKKHPYQDETYGVRRRLANRMSDLVKVHRFRCTVCGTIHS